MIALALLLAQAAVPPPAPIAPGAAAVAAGGPAAPAMAEGDLSAKDVFAKKCVFCHAEDGTGNTKKGRKLKVPNFTTAKWQKHTTDKEITDIIADGNKKRKMPAFKDKLTPDQIKALVPFLRGFAKQ